MKAISSSNRKEIKHENDLDFSVYAVIRLFSSIDDFWATVKAAPH